MCGIQGVQDIVAELLHIGLLAEFLGAVFANCCDGGVPFRLGEAEGWQSCGRQTLISSFSKTEFKYTAFMYISSFRIRAVLQVWKC